MSIDNVSVLAKAELDESLSPIKPQPLTNIAITIVVGLTVGIGLSFLLEYLDNSIKDEQDVESIMELSILAVISTIDEDELKGTSLPAQSTRPVRGETQGI
ncbi:hypothetical protein [Priestia megaterium]|uniref:hypothetical protein n=1 Tax=Priestia megaterium TaxID=1404 RepID=UPI00339A1C70